MRSTFAIALAALLGAGCALTQNSTDKGGKGSLSYGDNARKSYLAALEEFREGNCKDVAPQFRAIRREFPYSRFAALAELRVADCKLKQKKYNEAIQAYRQFTRFRPSHSQVPYARFKIAQAYFEQIPDDWLLSPPSYERDQGSTRDALRQLRRFVLDFPEDERVPEAREMMQQALKLLAQHELYVAKFYLERDAYQAAVARLETLLNTYQGSGVEPRALLLLGRTHLKTRHKGDARKAFERLVNNFPESGQASKAEKHLRELGVSGEQSAARKGSHGS
jgi:outer membrane protein assembly factor BamD